jgi:uncharacterized membrane protein HdeD (DUF308 family)
MSGSDPDPPELGQHEEKEVVAMQRTDSSTSDSGLKSPFSPDAISKLGRSWTWLLLFGIATLIAGILTIAWPGNSLIAIAIVVGVQLIINGIFRLVVAFSDLGQRHRAWVVFMGIFSIIVGMLCLRDVFQTIFALTLLVGIFWTVHGVGHVFDAFARQDLPQRGWAILTGALSIVAGIVIFAWPISSAFALALVLGVWLTVLGAMEIVAAVRLKRLMAGPVRV